MKIMQKYITIVRGMRRSRCFGETDLYCDYEKYINNIH